MLTPALRRTLPHLEDLDQAALMADLEAGGGDLFVYAAGEDALAEVSAWPLPAELVRGREENVFENPLEAVATVGGALVLGAAAQQARTAAALPHQREAARLEKLLQKLTAEETRLQDMVNARDKGLAVQGILWQHGSEARLDAVDTDTPHLGRIVLDKRLSLGENMSHFFHQAARGKRGLEHLIRRRENLETQLHALREAVLAADLGMPLVPARLPMKGVGKKVESSEGKSWPKGIQPFRSSDGFLILRGRDAKGNGALLRVAGPHDLWMHVDGGPGSHSLIRRAFAGQEIPETTLHEAASLAAVKSWQKDSLSALMLCAEARYVRPLRGAAPGTVRMDKIAQTFRVDIDATVETRLALQETLP